MRIAILGASSQIARDLTISFANNSSDELVLFARTPLSVKRWLGRCGQSDRYEVHDFFAFTNDQQFDVIINFVGIGDPRKTAAIGESIFFITQRYDELAISYVQQHPECRYIFLSSGAVYEGVFAKPVDISTPTISPVNNIARQNRYAVAKLFAEYRHRSLPELPIVDLRIFGYFSSSQDQHAGFFLSDALRALQAKQVLYTNSADIVRDFIGVDDFYSLVMALIGAPPRNDAIDVYTRAPVAKLELLDALKEEHGLQYEIEDFSPEVVNATGFKLNYYSNNFKAASFGYEPQFNSMDTVLKAMASLNV